MIARNVLLGVTILLIKLCEAKYDMDKYCQLVPVQTKLASFTSSQDYFTCLGSGGSVKSACPDGDVFDKNSQNCVPRSVDTPVYYDSSNPCEDKNDAFVYNSKGCNWYSYCVDGQIVGNDTCGIGEIFYPPNGTCINGVCDDNSKTNLLNFCTVVPDGVYFGDFDNCHDWHLCSGNSQQHGVCQGSLVFDTASGFCLPNNGNMCQRITNGMYGEASGPPQDGCTQEGETVGDTNVCSIYYVCRMKYPANTLEWVPLNCNHQYYDVINKQCRSPTIARVLPDCNRCQFTFSHSSTYWANAVDPSCQQYLTCRNGQHIGPNLRSCEEGHFFDQKDQACVTKDDDIFEEYQMVNGACQSYQCNNLRECSAES